MFLSNILILINFSSILKPVSERVFIGLSQVPSLQAQGNIKERLTAREMNWVDCDTFVCAKALHGSETHVCSDTTVRRYKINSILSFDICKRDSSVFYVVEISRLHKDSDSRPTLYRGIGYRPKIKTLASQQGFINKL
jgi:hypothetical protein